MNDDFNSDKGVIKALISAVFIVIIVSVIAGGFIYVSNYYETAEYPMLIPSGVEVDRLSDNSIVIKPENITAGLIFYPETKVDYTAYEHLMLRLSENNIFCVIVKMPAHNSAFKYDAAEDIRRQYPDIDSWYIAGHGKGAQAASKCISENADKYKGLIMLGGYSKLDISDTAIRVLSVYGAQDGVMNIKKYEKAKANLPDENQDFVIEGGNHSGFAKYGLQKGDTQGETDSNSQIRITSDLVSGFING